MFIRFTAFILLLSAVFAYADDNIAINSDNNTHNFSQYDNITAGSGIDSDNNTDNSSKSKSKIPPKLVPDRKINDKNQFMKDFGFPAREELKFNVNINAEDKGLYDDVTLSMANRWSKENIWGKDKLYIEGAVYGGMVGFSSFSINTLNAVSPVPVIPYGAVHLKFMSGSRFSPELKVHDSRFIFTSPDINIGESNQSYNYYYLKLPLGFSIPFFGFKSEMSVDGSFSSMQGNFQALRPFLIKGQSLAKGDEFNVSYMNWNVRLFLNTPVVAKPSILEYAYFGFYYDETTSPHGATPGSDYPGYSQMIINTLARSGGVFYDMQLDLYKGLLFGITVYVGIGDMEIKQESASYNVAYDGTKGLVAYKARISLGYEYIFKKHHVGISINAGTEYGGYVPFFFAKQENLFGIRNDGELRYFAELKFLFGY